jgi:hypothetical protein
MDARLARTGKRVISTFHDQPTAEKVIGDNISRHQQDVTDFVNGQRFRRGGAETQGNKLVIRSNMSPLDGTLRVAGGPGQQNTSVPPTRVKTVLQKDSNFQGDFRIVTSHPE